MHTHTQVQSDAELMKVVMRYTWRIGMTVLLLCSEQPAAVGGGGLSPIFRRARSEPFLPVCSELCNGKTGHECAESRASQNECEPAEKVRQHVSIARGFWAMTLRWLPNAKVHTRIALSKLSLAVGNTHAITMKPGATTTPIYRQISFLITAGG